MILQCPSCNARFLVPDAAMPPEGRTVKCGRCAHQWHAELPKSEEPALDVSIRFGSDTEAVDIVEQAARAVEVAQEIVATAEKPPEPEPKPVAPKKQPPAKPWNIPKMPFMVATPALALLWIVLAFMGHYPSWIANPTLASVYGKFGIHTTEGIVFEDMTMERQKTEGKTKYILSGSIANHASAERMVPTVRVVLNDAKGQKLWERMYEVNEPLKGGDLYPFRIDNVETSFGDKVATIVVDVGHSLQLMMR